MVLVIFPKIYQNGNQLVFTIIQVILILNAFANAKSNLPNLKNDGRMHVHLSGNHFQQNKVNIPNNGNVSNIYCVYKLDSIASTRDTS